MLYVVFNNDGLDKAGKSSHLEAAQGTDYTLCGMTLDSDPRTFGSYSLVERNKLTCPECVAIVRMARNPDIKI